MKEYYNTNGFYSPLRLFSIDQSIEYRNKLDNDKSSLHHSFLDDANNDFKKVDYHKIGLVKVYNEIFDDFCYNTLKTNGNFSWKYTIQNYTASGKNQFLRPHSHMPFADFATVHYIQFDNKRHEKNILYTCDKKYKDIWYEIKSEYYKIVKYLIKNL